MRRILFCSIALTLISISGAWAEEGRVRVVRSTVITDPGYYLVTQDITAPSGPVVAIRSSNVILDLGGHSVSTTAPDGVVIQLDGPLQNVEVKGGGLFGGRASVLSGSQPGGVQLRVVDVEMVPAPGAVTGAGINVVSAEYVEIRSCRITAPTGIRIDSEIGFVERNWRGRLTGNTIFASSRGMVLEGLTGGEILGNQIQKTHPGALDGILLIRGNGGNRVVENQVSGGGDGIEIESRAWDVDGNLISQNVLTGNGGHGVVTDGNRALLEGNVTGANGGCGISFRFGFSVPEENAYRDNMLRGNTGGGICGFPNTDAGGNIF